MTLAKRSLHVYRYCEWSRPLQLLRTAEHPARGWRKIAIHSQRQNRTVSWRFIKEGLELGEKAVHTVDPRRRDEHVQRLASAGIDMDTARQNGQFELRDWGNTHLRDGRCNLSNTLALFQEVVKDAKQKGFPLIRFVTHMEWALETEMDVNDLLEYEAKANDVWIRQDGPVNPVICTYDLSRFTGDVVVDVISVDLAAHICDALPRRFCELAVFDARLYIRVRRIDEPV